MLRFVSPFLIVSSLPLLAAQKLEKGEVCLTKENFTEPSDVPDEYYKCVVPSVDLQDWPWEHLGIWVRMTCPSGTVFSQELNACRTPPTLRRKQSPFCLRFPTICSKYGSPPESLANLGFSPTIFPTMHIGPPVVRREYPGHARAEALREAAPSAQVIEAFARSLAKDADRTTPTSASARSTKKPVRLAPVRKNNYGAPPVDNPSVAYAMHCPPEANDCRPPMAQYVATPCPMVTSEPAAAGYPCSWMMAPLVADPANRAGFLQCVPGYPGHYCGHWVSRPCPLGTAFDDALQVCVHAEDPNGYNSHGHGLVQCGGATDMYAIGQCNTIGKCPGQSSCYAVSNTCCARR